MNTPEPAMGQARQPAAGGARKRRFQVISHAGMLAVAVVLVITYTVLHVLGLRENVSLVFATSSGGSEGQMAWALLYVASYVGAVVLAPILILAAGIHFGTTRLTQRAIARRPEEA